MVGNTYENNITFAKISMRQLILADDKVMQMYSTMASKTTEIRYGKTGLVETFFFLNNSKCFLLTKYFNTHP